MSLPQNLHVLSNLLAKSWLNTFSQFLLESTHLNIAVLVLIVKYSRLDLQSVHLRL